MNKNSYEYLNNLPSEVFLEPENFRTAFDGMNSAYGQEQYAEGLEMARRSVRVGIGQNGTWFAEGLDGSFTTSYEGIGYHANTADLLRGFLDGPAEIVIYRRGAEPKIIKTKQ